MATNLALDDKLINEALRLGKHPSKKTAVTAALREYVLHRRQRKMLDLLGTIDLDPEYDYKAHRRGR